ncbi:hypothetical protein [Variovorax paradoxus]|uniref:hypothetical protein n=1 Tax=Variovorax paradoxus TaxID=34073 RepID=UPI0029C602A3|nr:hypothetical protein RZE77_31800 [Variovorax paradoxus]
MSKALVFSTSTTDLESRIGGRALIGGVATWPIAPNGEPLTLVATLFGQFLTEHTSVKMPDNKIVSVFSYYSASDYFLDQICFHGDSDELKTIQSGYTAVIVHGVGQPISQGVFLPARKIDTTPIPEHEEATFTGSKIGGTPCYLQQENISVKQPFLLQLYSGDYPTPFTDIFGLSDAVGYVFSESSEKFGSGLFFVQTT